MKVGEVVLATSITKLLGPAEAPGNYRETWKCRKGHRYVFVLLGIETDKEPLDPEKALAAMGWKKKAVKR